MTTTETYRPRPLGLLRHSAVLAKRSLVKTRRNPGYLVNGVMTPVIFLVLFLYLFGGAVSGSTDSYLQYLFPGILVMTTSLSGMLATGLNLNIDVKKGIFDRFRSLPIGRAAPLLGSVAADVIRYVIAVIILFGIGYALGFRVQTDLLSTLAAVLLAVAFGFCLSWVTVFLGVLVRDEGAVLGFSFVAFLPLVLGTSLSAPTDTLPGWLRAWANVNPVTHAMDACRALLNGGGAGEAVSQTLIWSAVLLVIFCPLAVFAYQRRE
ncbi:ABC transporter permease [Solwaraspora sp. WMMB335]|uniref:ABC transporter permease n=1 Tax=unclassified Solwaraspora TaxID=2627926 RepID=UPI00259B245A|nr:ABC transporter permease [Solwaraspora sp. WMMA2056]WJK41322.1 ABC transporter permease [Solwaraspora sp. WMMA2056]